MICKNVSLKGIRNIRELSQCEVSFGKIKKDILFRGPRLDRISDKKRNKFLVQYNIKTIIDLRTKVELDESKSFDYPDEVDFYHIPVLNHSFFGITHEKNMRSALYKESKNIKDDSFFEDYMIRMYKAIVFDEYSQKQFKEFFDVILNSKPGGILFHCAGGKDRTGIAALFLLTILGASNDEILEDYSLSDIANKRHNKTLTILMKILLPQKNFKKLLIEMLYAKREYLEKTIKAIEDEYGSVISFLEDVIEIDSSKQEKLKAMFLE